MQKKLGFKKLFKTIKTNTYLLESQIIKNDLNHKNCDYIPFHKVFQISFTPELIWDKNPNN
jgi:hypothetical protein